MVKCDTYNSPDVYEVSYVTLTTGIEPKVETAAERLIEFQFAACPEVTEAVKAYHTNAQVDAKRFSRVVARNFSIIRGYNRGGRQ